MSHKVQIKTQFREINPLLKAFQNLGWTVSKGVVARGWNSREVKDLVAVNPSKDEWSAADLIIEKGKDQYDVHTSLDSDHANYSLASLGGRQLNTLKQHYAIETIKQQASENGDEITVNELSNGTFEVLVTSVS